MSAAPETREERVEETMIRQARESFRRMPTLEMIIDRVVLGLSPEIKAYCAITPEVELVALDYLTYDDAVERTCVPSLIAVASAEAWKSQIACVVEPDLLFSVLEIMLGGRRTPRAKWVPRSFTAIEQKIGRQLAELCLGVLEHCWLSQPKTWTC